MLAQCSSSARGAVEVQDSDSDSDTPDLQLPSRSARDTTPPSTASTTTSSSSLQRESAAETSLSYAQGTAGSRSRNADILNRVNSRSGSRSRGVPKPTSASVPLVSSVPVRPAPTDRGNGADRPRPKPRAVPDFSSAHSSARLAVPSGASGSLDTGVADSVDNTVSPPRYVSTPQTVSAPPVKGRAVSMGDAELIELLRMKPKSTAVLRTTANFQDFFSGLTNARMKDLLEQAYASVSDPVEHKEKVDKRLRLMSGYLV